MECENYDATKKQPEILKYPKALSTRFLNVYAFKLLYVSSSVSFLVMGSWGGENVFGGVGQFFSKICLHISKRSQELVKNVTFKRIRWMW